MALGATIFKVDLQVSDLDRNHYGSYALTLARHPSETDERLMMRLLAFALNADEGLNFGKGLCVEDEPDLARVEANGELGCWIRVGLPVERDLRKACGRARSAVLYLYGGRSAQVWWEQNRAALERLDRLTVVEIAPEASRELAKLAQRNMQVSATVQDGQVWFAIGDVAPVTIEPRVLQRPAD